MSNLLEQLGNIERQKEVILKGIKDEFYRNFKNNEFVSYLSEIGILKFLRGGVYLFKLTDVLKENEYQVNNNNYRYHQINTKDLVYIKKWK